MATEGIGEVREDAAPEEGSENRHAVAKVPPLLKGDKWGGNGVAWQKFERWLKGEARKNKRASEEDETQTT